MCYGMDLVESRISYCEIFREIYVIDTKLSFIYRVIWLILRKEKWVSQHTLVWINKIYVI